MAFVILRLGSFLYHACDSVVGAGIFYILLESVKMEISVEVNISYPEKEVKKAVSYYILKIKDMRVYAFIAYPIISLLIILSLWYSIHNKPFLVLPIIFSFGLFIIHNLYYSRPIQVYTAYYRKRKGGTYKFYDNHICSTNDEIQSTISWSVYKKAYETPSAFLLIDDNRFIHIFPKICFDSVIDIDNLRDLLCMKMGM
ncbi:MAG: YcxB family protein [Oscillospiraceae bacterium]|nr:YcxB family protein [Oscillospiraceae bacterium]